MDRVEDWFFIGLTFALVGFVLSLVRLGLALFYPISDYQSKNDYSYIDMDGKTGFADYCSRDRGQLYCYASNKTIEVKEYTKIKEEE